jgi:hypothetical protein
MLAKIKKDIVEILIPRIIAKPNKRTFITYHAPTLTQLEICDWWTSWRIPA